MTPADSQLSSLLAKAKPATPEEVKEQGESLARNYKPGPRQAQPHRPAELQALPPLDVIMGDLERGYASFDKHRNDHLGAKGTVVGFGQIIGCRERQLAHALKMNRLILRESLTHKYGRNPTEEEMELNMRIWSDAAGVKE